MLIVNYFPGSYGDKYIAGILSKEPNIDQHGHTINDYDKILKFPEFYTRQDKSSILENLSKKYSVIGAHRQNRFDFVGYSVVTIDPRNSLDIVAQRFYYQLEHKLINYRHNRLVTKVIETCDKSEVLLTFSKEIQKWCDINILDTDKIVDVNELV